MTEIEGVTRNPRLKVKTEVDVLQEILVALKELKAVIIYSSTARENMGQLEKLEDRFLNDSSK